MRERARTYYRTVRCDYLTNPRMTPDMALIMNYFLAQADGFDVRPVHLHNVFKGRVGQKRIKQALTGLRAEGYISVAKPVRQPNGSLTQAASRVDHSLIIYRGEDVSPGRTARSVIDPTVPPAETPPIDDVSPGRTARSVTDPAVTDPTITTMKEQLTNQPLTTISNTTITKPDEPEAEPAASAFTDKPLAELIREAPDERALKALWQAHKAQWSAQLNSLALARKAEVASANVPEAEPESVSLPKPTQPAYESSFDVDDADETDTEYEAGSEYESESRFNAPELTGYRAKTPLCPMG